MLKIVNENEKICWVKNSQKCDFSDEKMKFSEFVKIDLDEFWEHQHVLKLCLGWLWNWIYTWSTSYSNGN